MKAFRTWLSMAAGLAATLVLVACSGTGFIYNNADWFLKYWANDYLELDGQQLASWEPLLDKELSHHRTEELPHIIGFIDGFTADAAESFDQSRAACLWDRFEQLYRRHALFLAGLATPLLANLTPGQIDSLETRFAKQNEDDPDPAPASIKRRLQKRGKRFASAAEWLVGPLNESQIALAKRISEGIPDTGRIWFDYRHDRQNKLIQLLRQKAGREEIHAYLAGWWADFRDGGEALAEIRGALGAGVQELIVGIGQSLTPVQREHMHRKLSSLRRELTKIQGSPQVVALSCGEPATAGPVRAPEAAPL